MSSSVTRAIGRRIEQCEQCGLPFPLSEPLISSDARIWICNGCGKEYRGQLVTNFNVEELRNLRPEPILFDRSRIPPASQELLETARRFRNVPDNDGRDKRRSIRYPVAIPVPAQAFDAVLKPIDTPFTLVARNISGGGICLLYDRSLRATFLGVELSTPGGELVQILVHVLRSRPRGNIHEIGGEFLVKMATKNSRVLR